MNDQLRQEITEQACAIARTDFFSSDKGLDYQKMRRSIVELKVDYPFTLKDEVEAYFYSSYSAEWRNLEESTDQRFQGRD